jgi:phosphate butyryltransferase
MKTPNDILERSQGLVKTIVIAAADDSQVLEAAKAAVARRIALPVLVGNVAAIKRLAWAIRFDLEGVELHHAASAAESVLVGADLVRAGRAEILMKGHVNSSVFLSAVLNSRHGLRKSPLLSHVALFFPAFYPKPVLVTDAGLNTHPSFDDKLLILRQGVEVLRKLGVAEPKVAILAHNEVPSRKVPVSEEAIRLVEAVAAGAVSDCIVEGPLALDLALDDEACRSKRFQTRVGGRADLLLCPDILSGNILYKAMTVIGKAQGAALIVGAQVPIVLTSRGDSMETKLLSIALAAATA